MEITGREFRTYTEADLTERLRQAQQGSPEALEEVFSFLRERILALAKRKVSNIGLRAADAEDATQETMIIVREHLLEFEAWENMMRFARQVLRNRLGNYHQYRLYRDPLEVPMEKVTISVWMDTQLEAAELERILKRVIEELRHTRPRYAVILRGLLMGLGKKELCQILRITPNHFDVELHRCRRFLRRLLKERWGIEW